MKYKFSGFSEYELQEIYAKGKVRDMDSFFFDTLSAAGPNYMRWELDAEYYIVTLPKADREYRFENFEYGPYDGKPKRQGFIVGTFDEDDVVCTNNFYYTENGVNKMVKGMRSCGTNAISLGYCDIDLTLSKE